MKYKEIQELLQKVRSKKSRLKALQSHISEEYALLTGIAGKTSENINVIATLDNKVEERYTRHIDRLNALQTLFEQLFEETCQEEDLLGELMKKLTPTEYEVILNRYMLGISRRRTANLMKYTEDGIKTIQKRALKKMSKK